MTLGSAPSGLTPPPHTHTHTKVIPKLEGLLSALGTEAPRRSWALGTLTRKAAYQQLRATACSIEHITGLTIDEWLCDDTTQTVLQPRKQGEARLLSNNRIVIRKVDSTNSPQIVVAPDGWAQRHWPVLTWMLDHCAAGSAGAFSMLDRMYLVTVSFDWFH